MKRPFLLLLVFVFAVAGCASDDEAGEGGEGRPGAPNASEEAPAASTDPASFTTTRGNTDVIRLISPRPGEIVRSPLTIRGEARGGWFFEGDFPITLTNWDGLILTEHYATARGEWMTPEYVPFEGVLEFDVPADIGEFSRRGSLILRKDNPSGLPEHDDAIEVTIYFR